MSLLSVLAILLVLAAAMTMINQSFLRLPDNIGLLVLSLLLGVGLLVLDPFIHGLGRAWASSLLETVNLGNAFLNGLLAFLLFAASIQVDMTGLWDRRWIVLVLSTVGVVVSTLLIGTGAWAISGMLGVGMPFIWCLLLGSILAPTDPVVISSLLGRAGMPRDLEATIIGESLFNDGVAVVLFTTLLGIATSWQGEVTPDFGLVARSMLGEAGGGALLGLAFGGVALWVLRRTNDYGLELLTTLALATSSYSTAMALHVSAPIAVVAAGLGIGGAAEAGHGRSLGTLTRKQVQVFWSLLDGVLNTLLFLALGLSVLLVEVGRTGLWLALLCIPVALCARFLSVAPPVLALPLGLRQKGAATALLTWGGLRGGISVALALSVPEGHHRDTLLAAAYAVTVWTIVVQGTTMGTLLRFLYQGGEPEAPDEAGDPVQPAPQAQEGGDAKP